MSRLLLDTHTLIWWLEDGPLSQTALAAIADPKSQIFVSMVSAYEIAFKVQIGKLPGCAPLAPIFSETMFKSGFTQLEATARHGIDAGRLPLHHRDPWDRILVAQALGEQLELVSNDAKFDAYGVSRLW
jgi:PIN domain nuclease of toxin-antitoxin system